MYHILWSANFYFNAQLIETSTTKTDLVWYRSRGIFISSVGSHEPKTCRIVSVLRATRCEEAVQAINFSRFRSHLFSFILLAEPLNR